MNLSSFPILHTERLELRQLIHDDSPDLFALRSDESVNRYLDRPRARSMEDAVKFIERINTSIATDGVLYWGIALKDHRKIIGTVCLWNFSEDKTSAEVGFELSPGRQGQGIMAEALSSVIRHAFEEMKLGFLDAVVSKQNERSLGLLNRMGFQRLEPSIATAYDEELLTLHFVYRLHNPE